MRCCDVLQPDEGLRSACESNDPSAVQMTPDMQRLHDIVYAPEDSDSLQAGLAYLWIGLFWVHANDIPQVAYCSKLNVVTHEKHTTDFVCFPCVLYALGVENPQVF